MLGVIKMIIKENGKFINFDKVNAVEVVQTQDEKYTLAFYLEGGIVCAGEYSTEEFADKILDEVLQKVIGVKLTYDLPVEQKSKEEVWKETVSERRE